jgi:hypothetical protein
MKPRGFIKVVKMWSGISIDPIRRCFDNPEGQSYWNLLVDVVLELSS